MGNSKSALKANFEDVQYALKHEDSYFFINTLTHDKQDCLIPHTVDAGAEERVINELMNKGHFSFIVIIYGENANDPHVDSKYKQLVSLGFQNVYVYGGGLFEWLLLGEIYGVDEFPRTRQKCDILRYKAKKSLGIPMLEFHPSKF